MDGVRGRGSAMQFGGEDAQVLERVMRWRRDVRHFRPDPIPEPVIDELARAMELAPSVGNSRPWRVIRVASPALRRALWEEFVHSNAEAARPYRGERRRAYARLRLAGLDRAPLQLAVFTDTDPPEGMGLGRATMPQTLHQSTAMAIHALWLAARARNLGLGMVSIIRPERVAALLGAPQGWAFSALLCLGRAAFDDDTPLLDRAGWQESTARPWLTA